MRIKCINISDEQLAKLLELLDLNTSLNEHVCVTLGFFADDFNAMIVKLWPL